MSSSSFCTALTSALNAGMDLRSAASTDLAICAFGLFKTAEAGSVALPISIAADVANALTKAAARCGMDGPSPSRPAAARTINALLRETLLLRNGLNRPVGACSARFVGWQGARKRVILTRE